MWITPRFHDLLTLSMSVKDYPTMNDNELWLLKNELLRVDGGMRLHPCIAQVGFESSLMCNV